MSSNDWYEVDSLAIRLYDFLYNSSTVNTDFYIAQYMLENLNKFPEITIKEVAKESFTSTTSVTKFTKRLGYDGFFDLRTSVKKKSMEYSFFKGAISELRSTNDIQLSLNEVLDSSYALEKKTFNSFNQEQITNIAKQISTSSSITLFLPFYAFEAGKSFQEILSIKGIQLLSFKRQTKNMDVIQNVLNASNASKYNFLVCMSGKWLSKEKLDLFKSSNSSTILITSDLNENRYSYDDVFSNVVTLNRKELGSSNNVSNRLFLNFFISLGLEIVKLNQNPYLE